MVECGSVGGVWGEGLSGSECGSVAESGSAGRVAECRSVGGGWLACWCEVVGGAKGGVAECRVGGEG